MSNARYAAACYECTYRILRKEEFIKKAFPYEILNQVCGNRFPILYNPPFDNSEESERINCFKKYQSCFGVDVKDFEFLKMFCVCCKSKLLFSFICSNLNKITIKDFGISKRKIYKPPSDYQFFKKKDAASQKSCPLQFPIFL